MLEYHYHTYKDNDQNQIYLFVVERTNQKIELKELYIIVECNGVQSKMRLDMSGMMKVLHRTTDGNVPAHDMTQVLDMFEQIMSPETFMEHTQGIIDRNTTNIYLKGSELANKLHESQINEILKGLKP